MDTGTALPATAAAPDDIDQLLERCRYRGEALDWDAIIGHEPAKRELRVIAEQYRRRSTAERLGLTLVKGIVIMGEPGCGKTLLARALAGAIDRPVYVIPAAEADATVIRRLYERLAGQPCLVVWDEADLILRARNRPVAPDDGRRAATFCTALDGIDPVRGPITVALTAEAEWALDASALRAGRLTTKVLLGAPDRDERRALFELYTRNLPVVGPLDLDAAADRSSGFTGADIEATILAALGLSMVAGIDALDSAHLEEAILRRNRVQERPAPSGPELEMRALHESGHAVYAALTWGPEAVASVTIRTGDHFDGRTVLADALRDEALMTVGQLRRLVRMAYAGMTAEALILGPEGRSLGGADDVARATRLLRRIATELGVDPELGPVAIDAIETGSDSDRGSESMRSLVFQRIRAEALEAEQEVRSLLARHADAIREFAGALLDEPSHTLSGPGLTSVLQRVVHGH